MESCIRDYVNALKSGGVIAFPTDTVWGLSGDAFSAKAISKLIRIKKRSLNKSFSVLIPSPLFLEEHVVLSSLERQIVGELWPGSFTIVLQAKDLSWSKKLGSRDGSLAFRCIGDTFTGRLLSQWGGVLITTSANFSGSPVCMDAKSILELDEKIKIHSYFMNFSEKLNTPSTVIKVSEGCIKILRKSYQYELLLSKAKSQRWKLKE